MQITIDVKKKIAISPQEEMVCGNSDYTIFFNFDDEWNNYPTKTARFVFNGVTREQIFEGNVCEVPVIQNATSCKVGVYAGDLHTTTPALVKCRKSILCDGGQPEEPDENIYNQLMQLLNELKENGVSDEQIAAAVEKYLEENPVEAGATEEQAKQIEQNRQDIADLKETGGTAGEDGEDGATFIPSINADGVLSWTNDKGLENPAPVNIKGADGETGDSGVHVGADEPQNGEDVWINPDGEEWQMPVATTDTLGGVKVGNGLRMEGDVLGVAENVYEHIETVIIGYELLAEKPEDWTTTFANYFKNTGTIIEPNLKQITEAKSWEEGKVYRYTGESATLLRTKEPNGTAYRFKAMAIKGKRTEAPSAGDQLLYRCNGVPVGYAWWGGGTVTSEQKRLDEMMQVNGYWQSEWVDWLTANDRAPSRHVSAYYLTKAVKDYPYITDIWAMSMLAPNTIIMIFGVRA